MASVFLRMHVLPPEAQIQPYNNHNQILSHMGESQRRYTYFEGGGAQCQQATPIVIVVKVSYY